MTDKVPQRLGAVAGAAVAASDYPSTGVHLDATVEACSLRAFAKTLRELEFLVESVSALDVSPRMMLLYHFTRVDAPLRVCARVFVERAEPRAPTISDIYPGANWHERETHDFFGVFFTDHPDMSPLILPEDAGDLKPLLKSDKALKDVGELLARFAAPAPAVEEKPEVAR